MQKQIHLSWINAKIGIWLWRKMLPFRAVSSSQISFCVHVYINAAQPYWGPVIKVNNPSSFLGYSQRTGRDQHFPGSYRWHHKINSSNQYVLGGGRGSASGKEAWAWRPSFRNNGIQTDQTGQAIGNTVQKNSRHLCQLLNCLCKGISTITPSAGLSCQNGMLRGDYLLASSISLSGYLI